jgi:hypothetical protein
MSNLSHNGNGHNDKAFELTRPKSAEEIARESILATMPELRRNCSQDRSLSVGAKWFFGQITDLTFLHRYGGDGFGRVYLSIKDLSRIYGHDTDSFKNWRDELVPRWLWFQKSWPKACWGVQGVTKQPELFSPHPYLSTLAKASKESKGGGPIDSALPPWDDKTEETGQNNGHNPTTEPNLSASKQDSIGPKEGILPGPGPNLSVVSGGNFPVNGGTEPGLQAGRVPHTNGHVPASVADGTGPIRETPQEIGVLEASLKRLPIRGTALAKLSLEEMEDWGQPETKDDFLAQMEALTGPDDHANWRALLSKHWAHSNAKCRRVLAETKTALREGRIKTTAGRYFNETWKHFA